MSLISWQTVNSVSALNELPNRTVKTTFPSNGTNDFIIGHINLKDTLKVARSKFHWAALVKYKKTVDMSKP